MNEGSPFREAAPRPLPPTFPPEQAKARTLIAKAVGPELELTWAGQPVPDYVGSYAIVHIVTTIVGGVWGLIFAGIGYAMEGGDVLIGIGGIGFVAAAWGLFAGPVVEYGRCVRRAYGITSDHALVVDVLRHTEQTCFFPTDLKIVRRGDDLASIVLTKDPEVIFERVRNPDVVFAALDRLPKAPPAF